MQTDADLEAYWRAVQRLGGRGLMEGKIARRVNHRCIRQQEPGRVNDHGDTAGHAAGASPAMSTETASVVPADSDGFGSRRAVVVPGRQHRRRGMIPPSQVGMGGMALGEGDGHRQSQQQRQHGKQCDHPALIPLFWHPAPFGC